ncbi:defender against death protein 1 [Gaertneriomyces semiglobifer]|nr:defender against death protein 1 [Gaertneriomyces semiglobifer]
MGKHPSASSAASSAATAVKSVSGQLAGSSGAVGQQADLVRRLFAAYTTTTPQSLKLIDAYLVFLMLTGVIQFVYVILAGTYPYNSFLAGFGASVGSFVLAANLRSQVNPQTKDFNKLSPERAFADFVFANIVLYAFVVIFLG